MLVGLSCIASLAACADNRHGEPQSPEPPFVWQPPLGTSFDMRNAPLVANDVEPTTPGTSAIFVDAWATSDATIVALQSKGYAVVARLAVGTIREDAFDFMSVPSQLVGELHPDGDGRRWLDVRARVALLSVVGARFDLLKSKGFDAIAPLVSDWYA